MKNPSTSLEDARNARLDIKAQLSQLKFEGEKGTNLSQKKAKRLTNTVGKAFLRTSDAATYRPGQIKYSCVKCNEPAGKAMNLCKMVTVRLTLLDAEDRRELCGNQRKPSSNMRRRRIQRITDEARRQGGLLCHEDLAELLMCDVRTIRRDVQCLKSQGIIIPTRGIVSDIGPGLTHKKLAIRSWLEGKAPAEIAVTIHHSLKATENYLEKFKRVCYLDDMHLTEHEMARIVGISTWVVRAFRDIHEEFKNKDLYALRMEEINEAGREFWQKEGEQKSLRPPRKRRKADKSGDSQ